MKFAMQTEDDFGQDYIIDPYDMNWQMETGNSLRLKEINLNRSTGFSIYYTDLIDYYPLDK